MLLPLLAATQLAVAQASFAPVAQRPSIEPPPPKASATLATATRAAKAPVIDGREDDLVWRSAQIIDAFRQFDPVEDGEPRYRTEAKVAYDDRSLFVFIRMFDPHPDSILPLLARRDVRTASDQVKIMIDSYHDRRSGYEFAVNPAGVKRDFLVIADQDEDQSWDGIWDVAARIDSVGWTAEYRIPLSQLRFSEAEKHTFGFGIWRDLQRHGERVSWPLYRRTKAGISSQLGDLAGLDGIPTARRIEVNPYLVERNVSESKATGQFGRAQQHAAGVDLKYGLTSNLTVDATVNPDFGQVEADPAVLNLTAFEQFFEERRPFFLEGSGMFRFDLDCNDGACSGLFYSRRIGRSPQLAGRYGDSHTPQFSSIVGASKLTGRLANGLSVGVLDAVTQRVGGVGGTAEPQTNYFTGRLQQDFRKGFSGLGLMMTATNRQLDPSTDDFLRGGAYALGSDFRHRFGGNNFEVSGYAAASRVTGTREAITRTQRNNVHLFQRPDGGLTLDTLAEALSGTTAQVAFNKLGGGIVRFNTGYKRTSPGFEINDLGFQPRADQQQMWGWMGLQYQKPAHFYRMMFVNFNGWNVLTTRGLPLERGGNVNAHAQFKNQMWGHIGINANSIGAVYDDRQARGGPAVRQVQTTSFWGGLELDRRKVISGEFFMGGQLKDASGSYGYWLNPRMTFRAGSRIQGSVGANYNRNRNDWQWYDNVATTSGTAYTFARLDQHTTSLTSRFDVTMSPTLTLQVYAQPFVTTGDYSNQRELVAPRATKYADRFRPFTKNGEPGDFSFGQFRSNTVLRWEYRPGSILFFVWQQGRTQSGDDPAFSITRGYRDLFEHRPNNTLLIKASYWLNP